jgi:ribonuclease P protein component
MQNENFPKSSRVTARKEYQSIYQTGNKVVGHSLVLYFKPNQLERIRLGISVSKKIGNAVVRNRQKRLFREIFRQNRHRYRPGYDLVCIARKPILKLTFEQLTEQLNRALIRAGILKV